MGAGTPVTNPVSTPAGLTFYDYAPIASTGSVGASGMTATRNIVIAAAMGMLMSG